MRLPARLLVRKVNSHKGDYGHVLILAGSIQFSGAALLCAEAVLRSGAGLVTLAVPKSIALGIIKNKSKEVMLLPLPETENSSLEKAAFIKIKAFLKNADVLIVGPGLENTKSVYALVRKILKETKLPTVVDATALSALSKNLKILKTHKGEFILTPHEKEFSRLFGVNIALVKKNRKLVAKKYAQYYNTIIVLKGHNSVVSNVNGQCYINKTGNPGMATAGSGDVLTGIIGAFLAQGLDGFAAAKYATYVHGLAGDIAAIDKTQLSLIASDILNRIPDAIKKCS
ncbi:MAG: NAD(P)H-hydrate dehydratase [Candidatus Omnitrophota bacterium]